jgi:hypothetical protein
MRTIPSPGTQYFGGHPINKKYATSLLLINISLQPRNYQTDVLRNRGPLIKKDYLKVLSKHMKLASSFFKAMLQSTLKEGLELQPTGHCQIPQPEEHPLGFEILLHLIHLNSNHTTITLQINFQLLANLAVLVDKYELQQTTYLLKDLCCASCLNTNNGKIPHFSCWELFIWVGITWVFERPREFKIATENEMGFVSATEFEVLREDCSDTGIPLPSISDSILGNFKHHFYISITSGLIMIPLVGMEEARLNAIRSVIEYLRTVIRTCVVLTYTTARIQIAKS